MIKVGNLSFNKGFVGNKEIQSIWYGPTKVWAKQSSIYDYGDGSYNMTTDGYKGRLYLNGSLYTTSVQHTNHAGNISYSPEVELANILSDNGSSTSTSTNYMKYGSSGWSKTDTNAHTFTHSSINGEYTMCYYFKYGSWIVGANILNFKLVIDGSSYTLQQAVSNNLIKPLVLFYSGSSGVGDWSGYNLTANNILNLYNASGGTRNAPASTYGTGDGAFSSVRVWFMTNAGHTFTGANFTATWTPFTSSTSYLSSDGLEISYCPIADYRFTLNAY